MYRISYHSLYLLKPQQHKYRIYVQNNSRNYLPTGSLLTGVVICTETE